MSCGEMMWGLEGLQTAREKTEGQAARQKAIIENPMDEATEYTSKQVKLGDSA